ncbi:hypothetical protein QL285_046377 [Trifolium repens]|nr:hypothetical protein QL285_046377 [Trifolium repens]
MLATHQRFFPLYLNQQKNPAASTLISHVNLQNNNTSFLSKPSPNQNTCKLRPRQTKLCSSQPLSNYKYPLKLRINPSNTIQIRRTRTKGFKSSKFQFLVWGSWGILGGRSSCSRAQKQGLKLQSGGFLG